jgi:hypothetical protein
MADIASNDIASNIEVMPENKTEEEGTAAIEAAKSNEEESVLGDLQSILESIPAAESVNTLKSMSDVFGEIDREASTDTDEVKETEAFEEESVEVPEEEPVKEELEEELVEEETPEEMPEEIPEKEPAVEVPVKAAYLPATLTRCVNHVAYVLEKPEIRIGKSPDNDICISDNPAISRVHAIIEGFQGEYRIKDNGSTNHSFVNGIVLGENQEKLLNNGDRILLANEEFIFKL